MAILTINDNPSITDTIVFELLTPDSNGCFLSNPYKVDKLVIYFVERDFSSGKSSTYENKTYDLEKLKAAEVAEANACANPTESNIYEAKRLRNIAESNVTTTPFHYNEAKPVHIVGNDLYPAWLSTDLSNSFLELVTQDENGNPVFGKFKYTWQPSGMREGDYFICWTWTPLIAGDSLSSHIKFTLTGNTQVTTSIPTHFTKPDKYKTLLERYLPEMFKMVITSDDKTPDVLDKFNNSIALGFNALEDLANQIVDLQDANSLHESLLPYLSNFFDLKLKTQDPTRWRGQIKRAVPLFKMKGTKRGLIEALEQASIKTLGITSLWQIISSYTWQESFKYDGINETFQLEKVALPIDYDNFELWLRPYDSDEWMALSSDYIEFDTFEGITTMTWLGSQLSTSPIDLIQNDEIRILYKYRNVPDTNSQAIENFIRNLPLMDQRDERSQEYPPKNWNVRVIPENDPMFSVVIPTRHPYHEYLVYGKVRTEFPYSENIYNMEEYNGSIRNSKNPCDIDKYFIDPCTACRSSCYNIDLEIENISNDRINEAKEVLEEYTPFHAVLHTVNFLGGFNEFIQSPEEKIEALVSVSGEQFVAAGEAQMYFNRAMKFIQDQGILRSDLADVNLVVPSINGTAYNDDVVMFCPYKKLDNVGVAFDARAKLHILSPSILSGLYTLINPDGNTIVVDFASKQDANTGVYTPATEPIDNCNALMAYDGTINNCAFTFDINNLVLDGTLCNVAQDNVFIFEDSTQNYSLLGVKSSFDVSQGTASSAWKILFPSINTNLFTIEDVRPDGSLIITNDGTLPGTTNNLQYYLVKPDLVVPPTPTGTGNLTVLNRGRVTALSSSVLPLENILRLSNLKYVFKVNLNQYPIIGLVPSTNNQFYIDNYTQGDIASANLRIDQKVLTQEVGYFTHRGLKIQFAGDLETSLGIQNGANSLVIVDEGVENDGFKENFIIEIDDEPYFISNIDGNSPPGYTTITLSGKDYYWQTLASGGTAVNAKIYKYSINGASIMGQQFDLPPHTFRTLDRSGRSVIDRVDQDGNVTGLSIPDGNEFNDAIQQNEAINFNIQYSDGSTEQGEI